MGDINFWELGPWHSGPWYGRPGWPKDWRWIPSPLSLAKITADPGVAVIPMRWGMFPGNPRDADGNRRDALRFFDPPEPLYPNYLLAFGLVPYNDNLSLGMFRRRMPIVRAAKELRGAEMADAKVEPAWWNAPVCCNSRDPCVMAYAMPSCCSTHLCPRRLCGPCLNCCREN